LYLLYARVAKFNHLAAVDANNMIMLFIAVRFFELGHIFTKLVFGHQIA
jgi:hypothetical protein